MAKKLRVALGVGPKHKRVVAVAPDWPGLERGGKTAEAAVETLQSYLARYAPVARLAGLESAFAAIRGVNVVEEYGGVGSTDFWGISFAFSSIDGREVTTDDLSRADSDASLLDLLRRCSPPGVR